MKATVAGKYGEEDFFALSNTFLLRNPIRRNGSLQKCFCNDVTLRLHMLRKRKKRNSESDFREGFPLEKKKTTQLTIASHPLGLESQQVLKYTVSVYFGFN